MARFSGKLQLGIALCAIVLFSACTASYRNHGYIPDEEQLSEIVVGVDTRDSVAEAVGSPTSAGILDDSGYYYVRSRVRSYTFLEPQVVERQVLAISFDSSGVVQNIERFGLEDGRVISLERRVTESSVVDRTFLRQLLGSLGRIAPPAP